MDKEEARFILRCFRPDGADAENPDFAEALAWAAKDRDLGEWLARERASDAGFARALVAVSIPASLREEILAGLAVERGDGTGLPDAFDTCVIGAMAAVVPPPGLRGEILAAMERTVAPAPASHKILWRFGLPAAAAAGIALAFLLSGTGSKPADPLLVKVPASGGVVAVGNPLTISVVESGFIKAFESPGFTLDLKDRDHHALFNHLKSAKLPCPTRCLPKGLKGVPGLGCRELEIAGKRGAVVCFKQENDKVHLVLFKRCDVKCKLPVNGKPDIRKHGNWTVARWGDEEWIFVLMGKEGVDAKRLEGMF
ncbi:MAG: hypothetical protein B9S38_09620 [Verrucomicrobiia bacterium Tous-C4TDCM]|nr:MAG: hypothetical protein B9S38_09620 [Verrucomicrobiae bacterium Tous-C4TDCM]